MEARNMNGSNVLDRPATEPSSSLVRDINSIQPGSTELLNEGRNRDRLTDTHTMRARELCPDQGKRAAGGFLQRIFG